MIRPGKGDLKVAPIALGVALTLAAFTSGAQTGDQPSATGGAPVTGNSANQQATPPVIGTSAADQQATPPGSPQTQRMLYLYNRMNELENEMRHLRGDVQVLNHDMQGLKDRQRELYLDIDRRLRALELGAGHAAGTGTPPASGSAASPTTGGNGSAGQPAPTGGGGSEKTASAVPGLPPAQQRSAYEAAFNLLKDGRYTQAISAFDAFLKRYPSSEYAGNAQYWLGEANYVSRNFKRAIVEFDRVLTKYPQSPKVPDATLKMGYTYYELGQWAKARSTLQKVIKQYPSSTAQRLAETRLQRMRKEGH